MARETDPSSLIDQLAKNIAGIESGGSADPYALINKSSGAIGKYQVMPANVPGWTMAALGSSMTPAQFRASPQAQEAVFRDQMQRHLQLYGPKDAASIWFTGRPYNVAGGAVKDSGGTTNANYVARATAGITDGRDPVGTTLTSVPLGRGGIGGDYTAGLASPTGAIGQAIAANPPAAAPPGGGWASLFAPGTDAKGNPTPSPASQALAGLKKAMGGGGDEGGKGGELPPMPQGVPAPGARNVPMSGMEYAPMAAAMTAQAAKPLSFGRTPFGANAGLTGLPMASAGLIPPGTSINSSPISPYMAQMTGADPS